MPKTLISITTFPASKKNIVTKIGEAEYQVKLKAKPEHNQANKLLILALAEYFHLPASNIKIILGHHSPHKRVELTTL